MSAEFISNPDEAKELIPRYRFFYLIVVLTFVLFTGRLWFLEVMQGSELREFSEKNRLKEIKIPAPRGLILDREGRILVENHAGFEAIISPQYVDDLDEIAETIAPIISMEPDKLVAKIQKARKQNGPFAPIKLKENLTREEVFHLKRIRLDTPGLDIRESIVRFYPFGENAAQLLGYVAEISKKQLPIYNQIYKDKIIFEQGDLIGKNGIEQTFERDVRGTNGVQFLQVDAYGREAATQTPNIYGERIHDLTPVAGNNVVLTIDRDIQNAGWKSFVDQGRIGGVVAMKANGEILAWISTPSYDPNEFSLGPTPTYWSKLINDPNNPLRNKVIQDSYAPGSTFKPLMAVTALENKVVTPSTYINCPGSLRFGKRLYHDSSRNGYGNITIFEALERSSNIFFFKMGIALGIDKMYETISQFGIGLKTGIEVPQESVGLMPNSVWKKASLGEEWQPGENLSNAIGQGFVKATPLQMAVAYSTIGQEGKMYKPFVVQKIIDRDGKTIHLFEPKLIKDITIAQPNGVKISPEIFRVVKEGMRRVVNGEHGTARSLKLPFVQIAGKTGTSQVMSFSADQIYADCATRPIAQRHHGWFVGWAPADKPEIIVAALAEHSCHGGSGAGPTVRDIIRAYYEKYHPDIIAAAEIKPSVKKAAAKPEVPEDE